MYTLSILAIRKVISEIHYIVLLGVLHTHKSQFTLVYEVFYVCGCSYESICLGEKCILA
jgi:hypothetical protein